MDLVVSNIPSMPAGLPAEYRDAFWECYETWSAKRAKNLLRLNYYNGRNRLKNMGIALPPRLGLVGAVVGWPAKAVNQLAARSRFDGFSGDDAAVEAASLICERNNIRQSYSMATRSELASSCAFGTVSANYDKTARVRFYSSLNAAGVWDREKWCIKYGITVVDADRYGNPTALNLYTDQAVVEMRRSASGWGCVVKESRAGRPLIEPLIHAPELDRPFGTSRISRSVRWLTDEAVRECVRTAVASEFSSAPQKYLLGADKNIVDSQTKWEAYIGAMFAVGTNKEGQIPQYGQLPQMTMQPHTEYMRSLAAQFSGETNVPISSLGVIHDNPSSAEAIYAGKEDLVIDAENLNDGNGIAMRNLMLLALSCEMNRPVDKLPPEMLTLRPLFRNPAMPSIVTQADAMVKAASPEGAKWIAGTEAYLEELGFPEAQRKRMLSDKAKEEAKRLLAERMSGAKAVGDEAEPGIAG